MCDFNTDLRDKMGGSVDEQTTKSVSSSRSPLPVSGFNSLASSRSSLSKKTKSPEPEEVIAELLEKAKFYTSLCLGKCIRRKLNFANSTTFYKLINA